MLVQLIYAAVSCATLTCGGKPGNHANDGRVSYVAEDYLIMNDQLQVDPLDDDDHHRQNQPFLKFQHLVPGSRSTTQENLPNLVELSVRTATTGNKVSIIPILLKSHATVFHLKTQIFHNQDVPQPFQTLVYEGKILTNNDATVFQDYNVRRYSTIDMYFSSDTEIALQCKHFTFFDKTFKYDELFRESMTFHLVKAAVEEYFRSVGIKNVFEQYSLYFENRNLLEKPTTLAEVWPHQENENLISKRVVEIRNEKDWFWHPLAH